MRTVCAYSLQVLAHEVDPRRRSRYKAPVSNEGKRTPPWTTIIAAAGWIVAVLSLTVNYFTYRDNTARREAEAIAAPKYTYEIGTLDPKIFPQQIVDVPVRLPHRFTIRHADGKKPIRGLSAAFSTDSAKILSVEIETNAQGTQKEISENGREASLSRDILYPEQELQGTVFTDRVAKIDMRFSALEGDEFGLQKVESSPENDWPLVSLLLLAWATALAVSAVIFVGTLERAGLVSHERRWRTLMWVVAGVSVVMYSKLPSPFQFPSISEVFYGLGIYILLAHYREFKTVLARAGTPIAPEGPQHDNATAATAVKAGSPGPDSPP